MIAFVSVNTNNAYTPLTYDDDLRYLTGLAPKALVVAPAPKLVGAAPKAGVCCCAVLLPKGVAGRVKRTDREEGMGETGAKPGKGRGQV